MRYNDFLQLYNNNEFRKIDALKMHTKFYYLRTLSKSKTFKKFCKSNNIDEDIEEVFANDNISSSTLKNYIDNNYVYKTKEEINMIESEINKMQSFDWGSSFRNNLESNIMDNYVKKTLKYNDIISLTLNNIQKDVYNYTLNSWYNYWTSALIEEIFNINKRVTPTIDSVKKIDFFIDAIPFDLKVTFFPDKLLKLKIESELNKKYGSKNELTCAKKIARELNIVIPTDLNDKHLLVCLNNLLLESCDERAQKYIKEIKQMKKQVVNYYKDNPNELIKWLYENQGTRRFDAANRFYIVVVDLNNIYDSWKLKRNIAVLKNEINVKLSEFSSSHLNKVKFYSKKNGETYNCISEILFIIR